MVNACSREHVIFEHVQFFELVYVGHEQGKMNVFISLLITDSHYQPEK